MEDAEALKKRKEKLELERDIARLERRAHSMGLLTTVLGWSWWLYAPVAGLGLFIMGNAPGDGFWVGVALLVPAIAKILSR